MIKILIAGGSGFIGRNLVEVLGPHYSVSAPSSAELDLLDAAAVREYLCAHHFDVVVHAASTRSNRRIPAPPDLLDRNLRMFFNLVRNNGLYGKLIHFGSGAEYDRRGLPSRVREDYFDTRVPADPYGFSKYICAKHTERLENAVELRLFAVFGKFEDYTVRFISNACCRALKGLSIVIGQDVAFDYLYVEDLAKITAWFIEHQPRHRAYNVCTGNPVMLSQLAQIVAEISALHPQIRIKRESLGPEYTGDNSLLLNEISGYEFRHAQDSIRELYAWYAARQDEIDAQSLQFDG